MMKLNSSKLNRAVFIPATVVIALLLSFSLIWPSVAKATFSAVQSGITVNGSWYYVLAVGIILGFVVYLGMSRFGDIKLGPDHSTPDYSMTTWLSMLFAAGMGIGLMFFGVAEPLMHYLSPPTAEKESLDAIRDAMKITFFHWGFHAWAIYAIVALILAYFSYRQGLPLTLRSALYPIIGDKIYGWQGHVVDVFAVVGTVFGVATSLGLGASQVNAGLNYLFEIDVSQLNQMLIMIAIVSLASVSVVTGLDKGIKILSEVNMGLAVMLLLLIFVLGPTVFLLQAYVQNFGGYLSDIVSNTFNLFAYEKKEWIGGWTIFYWGWWLAWAPFVGLFIARISKGRTIREFVLGVLIVPTMFTLLWMTIFGNSAISQVVDDGFVRLAQMVGENTSVSLFVFLESMPWSTALTGLSILMIVIFFVTSCDSGAMVIDMLCSNGNNDTPVWQRLFWAVCVGLVAIALSYAGGLEALQTMTIASALPFSLVLLAACIGLVRALRVESAKRDSMQLNVSMTNAYDNTDNWQEKLDNILSTPTKQNADVFIKRRVSKAFNQIKRQFEANDIDVEVEATTAGLQLKVYHGDEHDFVYAVKKSKHLQPEFSSDNESDSDTYYRAEVHLVEGGQDYDIMGWSEAAVLNDIVDQYQKHLHFLHLIRD
ncbi:BCCT family transporter [Thalassotalea euphylliae]|uniref:BCCT family transporter n=1 Tax=Thalassotalea euphylliae TaxID=1655234 RepID=A0A3E0TSV0_9GAMM|nr:choline BCCT transporter BetT [Thalassotalea euphylliae]REL27741.1 BCCT family transporter [Thalassotalea euphylliae]